MKRRDHKAFMRVVILLIVDVLSLLLGFFIAFVLRGGRLAGQNFELYIHIMPIIFIVLLLISLERRLYMKPSFYFLDEAGNIFLSYFLTGIIFTGFMFAYKIGPTYSRLIVGFGFLLSLVINIVLRYVIRVIYSKVGLSKKDVLIVGAGTMGNMMIKAARKQRLYPYNIIGILDDFKVGEEVDGIKVVGRIDQIDDILKREDVDEVIFAAPTLPREKLLDAVDKCNDLNVETRVIPNVFGLATVGTKLEEMEGILFLNVKKNKIKGINAVIKRTVDVVGAIVALIIFSPLFAVIAIMIKLDSPGPVFFGHKRIAQNGKTFYCLKFRTMVKNAQEILQELLESDPEAKREFKTNFKLKSDPRITRIGKFLRKTSLDEFPQFINVLKGEMSLVGPRPIVEREIEKYGKYGETLLKVKPGITGFWQISGRNDVDYEERIALDMYYIQNWSLWLDIKIILRTVPAVLAKKGAY